MGAKGAPAQVVDHVFDADAFGHIRRKAREHDVSVNDVFMGAVFQTLVEWNASTQSSQWFRLMVPMDERSRDRAEVDTSHALGFAFVDRRGLDCVDTSSLLRGIGEEMRSARLNYIGRRFFDSIAAIDRIPGMLRLILRVPRTFSTAIFSNVGRIGAHAPVSRDRASVPIEDRFPTLRQVRGIAPLRPGTRAAFLLTRVQDEHTLMLRTDPRYLDEAAARSILEACVGKVISG